MGIAIKCLFFLVVLATLTTWADGRPNRQPELKKKYENHHTNKKQPTYDDYDDYYDDDYDDYYEDDHYDHQPNCRQQKQPPPPPKKYDSCGPPKKKCKQDHDDYDYGKKKSFSGCDKGCSSDCDCGDSYGEEYKSSYGKKQEYGQNSYNYKKRGYGHY